MRSRMADGVRHQPMKQSVAVCGPVSGLERLGVTLDEVVEDGCGRAAGGVDASGEGSGHPLADAVAQVMVQTPLSRPLAGCCG
jgi:hypothetical protein